MEFKEFTLKMVRVVADSRLWLAQQGRKHREAGVKLSLPHFYKSISVMTDPVP